MSRKATELSRSEMTDSVPLLLRKIIKYRPKLLCIVGKSVWDAVQRAIKNGSKYGIVTASAHDDAMVVSNYGLQLYRIMHSSPRNATTEEGEISSSDMFSQ